MHTAITILVLAAALAGSASASATLIINEILADPDTSLGDANRDGHRSASQDEFIELVNTGGEALEVGDWTLADAVQVRHRFAATTRIEPWQAIVVFGGGMPSGEFGGARLATASTGSLSLNNAGDSVQLHDSIGNLVEQVTYGVEGGRNASLTRAPDLYGPFTLHTDVASAQFSPGTLLAGGTFASVPTPRSLGNMLIALAAAAVLRRSRRKRTTIRKR